MALFRRRSAQEREADRQYDSEAFAAVYFRQVVERYSPFFPDDESAKEKLGEALTNLIGSYPKRMSEHDALRLKANKGDVDAMVAYARAARTELVLGLEEQGDDASIFKHDVLPKGPYEDSSA